VTDDDRARQSPPPFLIPSISIWGILVFLVRDFGFYLFVAAILGALTGGVLLGFAGGLLSSQLTGAWISDSSVFSKVAGYVIFAQVTLLYAAGGTGQGFLFSVISFVLRKKDTIEKKLHEFLEPMSQSIVARIPFGQDGIPVESVVEVFDPVLENLYLETRPKRFSIFFAGNALVRFAFRLVIRSVRWAVREFFVEELQEKGVTHLNMTQMERFMREKMTDVVLDRYTLQLKVVRGLVLIGGAVVFFVTLGVYGALLIG